MRISELEQRREKYWAAISEVLHIRPWEINLLTVEEFVQACDYIDKRNEEMKKAE